MSRHNFRQQYRAKIAPSYHPVMHAGFVLGFGLSVIVLAASRVQNLQPIEFLSIVLTLLAANLGEYVTHRYFGHTRHRLGALFYQRHTVDHHGFFAQSEMAIEHLRDWRVVLFPTWLIVIVSVAVLWPLHGLTSAFVSTNAAALCVITGIGSYLLYEALHLCYHLPDEHVLARLPYVRYMRAYHAKHHDPSTMREGNFNLTWPLSDWLFGTVVKPDRV